MGTEVLYPHDVLSQRLRPAPAAFLPRRKPHRAAAAANTHFNTNFLHRYATPSAAAAAAAADCSASTNPSRTPAREKREVSPKAAAGGRGADRPVAMVTILRRGDSIDGNGKASRSLDGKKKKMRPGGAGVGGGGDGGIVSSSRRCGDLIVSGDGLLGRDPRRLADREAAMYAGSGFSASPSPDNLPMPKFNLVVREGGLPAVDLSATNDLRRLLRIRLD